MTKKMVKFTVTVAALAMTLLMTQCRKPNVQTPGGSYEGTSQYITFSTGDDSKIAIETAWRKLDLKWQSTDKLYVYGSQIGDFTDGKYCGVLNIVEGVGTKTAKFGGKIDNVPAADGKFRFYYFAGGSRSADLSSQDGTTAGLAASLVAKSVEDVTVKENTTEYGSTLGIPYAIALFDFKNFIPSTGTINMEIMGNTANSVSVDEKGILTFTKAEGTDGTVTITGVGTTKTKCYVAIMPVAANKLTFYGDGKFYFGASTVQFAAGKYYYNNNTTSTVDEAMEVPTVDCIPGLFSVSATGKKVRFSKGNLQYLGKGTDETHNAAVWRFADHQWDIMGASYGNGTLGGLNNYGNVNFGTYYTTYNSNASGEINQSTNKEAWDLFVYDEKGFSSTFSGWRQLNITAQYDSEWRYLINREYKKEGATIIPRYGMGYVHGVKGIILLPDDMSDVETLLKGKWKFGIYVKDFTNVDAITAVKYDDSEWQKLESAGAVFLPCAGWRSAANAVDNVNTQGRYYHINTPGNTWWFFEFQEGSLTIKPENSVVSYNHAPIRLVQEVSAGTE